MNKPSNWYNMTWEEQQEWQKQQRAIEDAEYETHRVQEEAENERASMRRSFARERESFRADYESLSLENDELRQRNAGLLNALKNLFAFYCGRDPVASNDEELAVITAAQEAIAENEKG